MNLAQESNSKLFPKKIVRIEGPELLHSMAPVSAPQKTRIPVPIQVPRLGSSTPDGKPYERSGGVQAEISRMLSLPQSVWIAEAGDLQNETLVFLIRRTHGAAEELCGQLLEELRKRIASRVTRFTRDLDDIDAEDIVLNVELKVLEHVLTKELSRKTDFLEIAFAQAIERLTRDAMRKYKKSPMGNRGEIVADSTDEDGHEIDPFELIPDAGPNPQDLLLNLEAGNHRDELLRKACEAVENPRHLEAVILHYAHGWPITTRVRGKNNLQRHFRATSRQIKYWIATGLAQMRAALA